MRMLHTCINCRPNACNTCFARLQDHRSDDRNIVIRNNNTCLVRTGTDRDSDIRAHRVRSAVRDAHNPRSQTTVSHSAGVDHLGVRGVRPVCVPEEEVVRSRCVYNILIYNIL